MPDSVRFLAIIPARYASSRFPGKPLAEIDGKLIIERVYRQVVQSFDMVYVATDDERILNAVAGFRGKTVMTSPDHRSGTDRCAEAAAIIEKELGMSFDVVVNVQGDEPFIRTEQLSLIRSCFADRSVDIATLVKSIAEPEELFDPNKVKVVVSQQGEALYFSRSPIPFYRGIAQPEWVGTHVYYKHIGLYGYKKEVLSEIARLEPSSLERAESLEQLRWLENGYRIFVLTTPYDSYGIDTPEDLQRVKEMFGPDT